MAGGVFRNKFCLRRPRSWQTKKLKSVVTLPVAAWFLKKRNFAVNIVKMLRI
jgi:hypothetical protein